MSKWEYARSLAAALMLFLNRQGDAYTLSLVGEELEDYIRPMAKQSHFIRLLAKLHREASAAACNWDHALDKLGGLIRKRSIVILISDFYTDTEVLREHLNRLRFMKCEALLFNILDPSELDFDFDDALYLSELESGNRLRLSPDLVRDDYRQRINNHLNTLSDMVKSYGGDYMLLRTDVPPLKALGKYLNVRSDKFK